MTVRKQQGNGKVMHDDGLWLAIRIFKTQRALAKKLGVSAKCVNHWVCGRHHMSSRLARRIVKITKGKVSYESLHAYLNINDREDAMPMTDFLSSAQLIATLISRVKEGEQLHQGFSEIIALAEYIKQRGLLHVGAHLLQEDEE